MPAPVLYRLLCGRLSLFALEADLAERFDATPTRPLRPRYNVAPGQEHLVVRNDAPEEMRFPTWGLVPHWADEFRDGHINVRAETLAEKSSFPDVYRERQCLVLVDGFYDWKRTTTGKQPYQMTRSDGEPFAMAGLWELWNETRGGQKTSFTVVMTESNDLVDVLVFALGGVFLLLGVTITTTPPAPYFQSTTDRLILIGVSLAAMVVGAGIVRGSLSLGRW
ncbi:SOS response-associated peptidase [Haladaptatus halobius]|uniref:SOS response-associated peptidase n=1 Tax=Haladaptatus halobius TaxID=2884875 RepID=UPI001D0A1177|nr:SOS response-associated peptidase [Haladaptatus halobius]